MKPWTRCSRGSISPVRAGARREYRNFVRLMRRAWLLGLLVFGCGQVERSSLPGGALPADFTVTQVATGSAPLFVKAADLNGDGASELIASDRTNNKLQIVTSSSLSEVTLSKSPGQCAVGDFVGDGRPDLAVALRDGSSLLIFDGADPAQSSEVNVGTSPQGVACADLDGDGRSDLVVGNVGSNDLTVLWGQAGGGFAAPLTLACGNSPVQVLLQDANGDGQADILVSNFGSGSVSILNYAGSRSFVPGQTLAVGQSPFGLAGGDFNGDGKLDLAVANEGDGTVTRWLMGDGALGQALTVPAGQKPDCLVAWDVNQDNVLDLLVTLEEEGGVAVLTGDGQGGFARTQLVKTNGGPVDIQLASLDGTMQAVTANFFGQGLSVLTPVTRKDDTPQIKKVPATL